MSCNAVVQIDEERMWAIGSRVLFNAPKEVGMAFIVVPVNQLHTLSDNEIGLHIRSLIRPAKLLAAQETASFIDDETAYKNHVSLDNMEQTLKDLEEFEDDDESIAGVVLKLRVWRDDKLRRTAAKAQIKPKRQGVRSQYERLFVAIGRRDGFTCVVCGSSSADLQIDHIIPVAEGGGNDIKNLQLLCPPCNNQKSDRM